MLEGWINTLENCVHGRENGELYVGTQSRFQIKNIVRPKTKTMFSGCHQQPNVGKQEGQEVENKEVRS